MRAHPRNRSCKFFWLLGILVKYRYFNIASLKEVPSKQKNSHRASQSTNIDISKCAEYIKVVRYCDQDAYIPLVKSAPTEH